MSLHDVQVLDVWNMAIMLGAVPTMIIYGIEPYEVELGLGLSKQMAERLPVLLEHVQRELTDLVEANTNFEITANKAYHA